MKRGSTLFLKIVILLIAVAAVAGMIRFPQTEGRAAHLDLVSIYADPFIIYLYIAFIPFLGALYYAFKLLEYVDKNNIFFAGCCYNSQEYKILCDSPRRFYRRSRVLPVYRATR